MNKASSFFLVVEVGYQMSNYFLMEDDTSSVCVTFNEVLEKYISVNYSFTDVLMSGEQ